MKERELIRGLNNFEGSIDEAGNLYDESHSLVGRIEGNEIYDYCNIKQGTIDSDGMVWDASHNYVGQSHGNNFVGPLHKCSGMSRGDSFGEGNGYEYGALMMLKKQNERYSGVQPDNNYVFPDNDDDDDDDDEDEMEDDGEFDECDDYDECEEDEEEDECDGYDEETEDVWLRKARQGSGRHGSGRSTASPAPRKQFAATARHSMPTARPVYDRSYVPPDSDFSTGKKNEYCINGLIYVDVSWIKSEFWSVVVSAWAALNGKAIITGWDRLSGAWDRLKGKRA